MMLCWRFQFCTFQVPQKVMQTCLDNFSFRQSCAVLSAPSTRPQVSEMTVKKNRACKSWTQKTDLLVSENRFNLMPPHIKHNTRQCTELRIPTVKESTQSRMNSWELWTHSDKVFAYSSGSLATEGRSLSIQKFVHKASFLLSCL